MNTSTGSGITVVINAAGRGIRLGLGRPKCLVEILGRSIIGWQLDVLRDVDVVVVVGFMADDVREHIDLIRPGCRVTYNPDYAVTGTSASLALGAGSALDVAISLDGDLLVAPDDLHRFVTTSTPGLVGITPRASTTAVGVRLDEHRVVEAMGFDIDSPWEWSGLLRMPSIDIARFGRGHVFESLIPHLPLPCHIIDCVEIDEPHDIQRAEAWLAARTDWRRPNGP